MLGFGRAAREVCAIALRRRVCFGHLVSAKYECELEALSFSESKSASGSSYSMIIVRGLVPLNHRFLHRHNLDNSVTLKFL